jgi:hypothetical protein
MQPASRSLGQGSAVPGEVRLAAAWNLKYHSLLSDCLFFFLFFAYFLSEGFKKDFN